MSWFYLALLAPLLWAVVTIIDDNLLRNVYRSASFGAIISGLFGAVPAVFLFTFNDHVVTEPRFVLCALAAGIGTVVFYFYYLRTLGHEEPSVAIALLNLAPAMVPLLAFAFLQEKLKFNQYVGISLLLGATLLISVTTIQKIRFSRAMIFALYASLTYALVSIAAKYAYQGGTFREMYAWISLGFGIGGLSFLLASKKRGEIISIVRGAKKKILAVLVLAELVNIVGELVQGYAISSGPVSIVRAMEGLQPIYVLLLGVALHPFLPSWFREKQDKRLPRKLILMMVMIAALLIIYAGT